MNNTLNESTTVYDGNKIFCEFPKLKTVPDIYEYIKRCEPSLLGRFNQEVNDFKENIKFSAAELGLIIGCFVVMISVGVFGNTLVIATVARNKHMRTPRNLFILNLAMADFILCIFTQPITLIRLLGAHVPWLAGHAACKIAAEIQAANTLASAFSITAVALDRFKIIVFVHRESISYKQLYITLMGIWVAALVIAIPVPLMSSVIKDLNNYECKELKSASFVAQMKIGYSVICLVVIYIIPLLLVVLAHRGICLKLNRRVPRNMYDNVNPSAAHCLEARRQRRTRLLLILIIIIFGISWLPLNVTNLYMDIQQWQIDGQVSTQTHILPENIIDESVSDQNSSVPRTSPLHSHGSHWLMMLQGGCLLLAFSSACTNPLLYGWFNDNFRKEFVKIFTCNRHVGNPTLGVYAETRNRVTKKTQLRQLKTAIVLCDQPETAKDYLLGRDGV